MHAVDLADLAGTFVRGTPILYALRLSCSRQAAEEYWLTSRYRHENWMHELSLHRDSIARSGTSRRARLWQDILPIFQEILLSEPLSRVIAYHAAVLDEKCIDHDLSPLATSSLAAHVEARNRCLHAIVFGHGIPVENAVSLNRLRHIMESYTDGLLSCLPAIKHYGLYCFEPSQFPDRLHAMATAHQTQWVTLQTLSLTDEVWHAFRHIVDWRVGSGRLNYQLSQQVLKMTPAASFDDCGVPFSTSLSQYLQACPDSPVEGPGAHPLFTAPPITSVTSVRQRLVLDPRRPDER